MLLVTGVFIVPLDNTYLRIMFVALFMKYAGIQILREECLVNYNSAFCLNFKFLLIHKIIQTVPIYAMRALNTSITSSISTVGNIFMQTLTC